MPNERLTVTIEGKDQLSPVLSKVAKQASAVDDSIRKITAGDLENWGRTGLRAAGALATGLFGLAKASSDVAEAQNFTNQIFRDAAPAITKFAQSADKALGLSQKGALDAAASLGIFGQRIQLGGKDLAKFSTDLVRLASDMASIKNTRVEDAVTAIAAAMRNEYEPIRRYGVVLNDVVLKARALEQGTYDGTGQLTQQQKIIAVNAELFEQLNFAMGDFARTSGELANQQRIAQAQWENLRANLGDALRPAFISLTKTANDFLGVMMAVPEPIKVVGANAALAATAVLGLGGAFLFTVGKIGQAVENFRELRTSMRAIQTDGTRAQRALLGIGKAAAGIGVAVVASQVVFDSINAITGVANKGTTAVKNLNIALAAGRPSDAWSSFLDIAKAEDDTLKFSHLWTDMGKKIQLVTSDTKRPIEDLDAAFKKLMDQDPNQAAQVLDIMREQTETLDKSSGQYKDNTMLIERWNKQLETTVGSLQATGEAGQLSQKTLDKFGDSTLTAAEKEKIAAEESEALAEMMNQLADAVGNAEDQFGTMSARAETFQSVLGDRSGTSQYIDNVSAILQGIADLDDAWTDAEGAIDQSKTTLDLFTESGRENLAMVDELAALIGTELTRVYQESDGDLRKVNATAKTWTDNLYNQLIALGLSTEQAQAYVDQLNLTPENIKTTVELADQQLALQKLQLLNLEFEKLPPEVAIAVTRAMDEGDFVEAYQIAKNHIEGKPLSVGIEIDDPTRQTMNATAIAQRVAKSRQINTELNVRPNDPVFNDTYNYVQAKANANPIGVKVQPLPDQTKMSATWAEVNGYYAGNPASMKVHAKPGDVGSARNDMQSYYNNNPLTVRVRGVASPGSGISNDVRSLPPQPTTPGEPTPTGMASVTALPMPVTAGISAPTGTAPLIGTVNVNLPVGVNENKVVDLLRRHARSNGRSAVAPLIRRRA